jgi:hypothetical protein
MPQHGSSGAASPVGTSVGLEEIVERFECAWRQGGRPELQEYLPADGSLRLAVLVELVNIDLECRLKAGEPARVEEYLRRYPELAEVPEAVPALASAEYRLRRRSDPNLTLTEYLQRFPQHRRHLAHVARTLPATPEEGSAGAGPSRAPVPPPVEGDASAPGWPEVPGYRILGELGRGGMGVVYQAWQESLDRPVALKVILDGEYAGPEERRRFRAEAEAIAHLQHPNIVQVYEVGEYRGRLFYSMELVDGTSLAERGRGIPLPAREAAAFVETLAQAVDHAHQRGVVHRDLKPANVLLPEDGTPKIADFGLAKRLDRDGGQTQSGAILGTPSYMAPEQASGRSKEVDPATDVYALGAILYELLTGHPPFRAETALDTLQLVISEQPVPLRRITPGVPADLEAVCLKCLEKAPERRYASARALAEDLRQVLNGEPVRVRPPGLLDHLGRWVKRRREVVWAVSSGLTVLCLALLVGGLGLVALRALRVSGDPARRTPVIIDGPTLADPVRNGDCMETVLVAEVESLTDEPLLGLRVEKGGLWVQDVPPESLERKVINAGITRWKVKVPRIPLAIGENRVVLVVTNKAGNTTASATIISSLNPRVLPPQIVTQKEVMSPNRHYTLRFRGHSLGGPLKSVRVAMGPDGTGGEEVKLDENHAPFGPAADKHYLYELEHELQLTQATRVVTIRAENAGGSRLVDVPATYLPRPPKLELELHRGQFGVAPGPAAPGPKVTLTGRVTWHDDDKEAVEKQMALLKNGLRVYVNDFRQVRPRVSPVRGRQGVALIEADVVLNRRSNEVKFECLGLPLADPVRIACKQPWKATLYLLVVDVDNLVGKDEVLDRVRMSLGLPAPGQPFQSSVFREWRSFGRPGDARTIVPLSKERANRNAVEEQLHTIGEDIAKNGSPADVVLIYWVGPEAQEGGRPVLKWPHEDSIPLRELLGIDDPTNPEPVGAPVLLLDTPAGGEDEAPRIVWESGHVHIIRYSWAHDRKGPGLLKAIEMVVAGRSHTLDPR